MRSRAEQCPLRSKSDQNVASRRITRSATNGHGGALRNPYDHPSPSAFQTRYRLALISTCLSYSWRGNGGSPNRYQNVAIDAVRCAKSFHWSNSISSPIDNPIMINTVVSIQPNTSIETVVIPIQRGGNCLKIIEYPPTATSAPTSPHKPQLIASTTAP